MVIDTYFLKVTPTRCRSGRSANTTSSDINDFERCPNMLHINNKLYISDITIGGCNRETAPKEPPPLSGQESRYLLRTLRVSWIQFIGAHGRCAARHKTFSINCYFLKKKMSIYKLLSWSSLNFCTFLMP